MNIFEEELDKLYKEMEEIEKKVSAVKNWEIKYNHIKNIIPDVKLTFWRGCVQRSRNYEYPILESESVNKDFDVMSFGGRGCCNDGYEDPYYVRAIKIVDGIRIRGTELTQIAETRWDHDGLDPLLGWEHKVEKANGEKAVEIVRKHLEENTYVEEDDDDD